MHDVRQLVEVLVMVVVVVALLLTLYSTGAAKLINNHS